MKPVHFITIILVVFIAWASLFITGLNQSNHTNQLLKGDKALLNQDTDILNAQKKTEADLQAKIADLQNHIDCLFKIATTPHSTTAPPQVLNIQSCQIASATAPTPTTAPKTISTPKVTGATPQPTANSSTSSVPASQPSSPASSPTSTPSKPGLVKQVLNFLGL